MAGDVHDGHGPVCEGLDAFDAVVNVTGEHERVGTGRRLDPSRLRKPAVEQLEVQVRAS